MLQIWLEVIKELQVLQLLVYLSCYSHLEAKKANGRLKAWYLTAERQTKRIAHTEATHVAMVIEDMTLTIEE